MIFFFTMCMYNVDEVFFYCFKVWQTGITILANTSRIIIRCWFQASSSDTQKILSILHKKTEKNTNKKSKQEQLYKYGCSNHVEALKCAHIKS